MSNDTTTDALKLERTIEQWRACDPSAMKDMSSSAIWYAFDDAKHDILALAAENARLRQQIEAAQKQEPVAVVSEGFSLFWVGSGPIAPIVERHSLKVGSPLYAQPIPAGASAENRGEDARDAARYRAWRDNMISGGGAQGSPFHLAVAAALPQEVGKGRAPTAAEWDAAIDAAMAASPARDGKEVA